MNCSEIVNMRGRKGKQTTPCKQAKYGLVSAALSQGTFSFGQILRQTTDTFL